MIRNLRSACLLLSWLWVLGGALRPCGPAHAASAHAASVQADDSTTVLALGGWFRLRFEAEGVYRLTPEWLQSVGISPSLVRTDRLALYGGGRGSLPEANATPRPSLPMPIPIQFHGDLDGVFEPGEFFLYYVPGSENLTFDRPSNRLVRSLNPYSDATYLYLHPNAPGTVLVERMDTTTIPPLSNPTWPTTNRADGLWSYERDLVNPIKSGREWLGEDFDGVLNRTFSWNLPHYQSGDSVTVTVRAAVRSQGAISPLNLRLNGQANRSLMAPAVGTYYLDPYYFTRDETWSTDPGSARLDLNLVFNKQNSSAVAWLDRWLVRYRSALDPGNGPTQRIFYNASTLGDTALYHWAPSPGLDFQVWDVTLPWGVQVSSSDTFRLSEGLRQGILVAGDTLRHLVMLRGVDFPNPAEAISIAAQNLHGRTPADMVILAPTVFHGAAVQLSELHAQNDGLTTLIVDPESIYREFSASRLDPVALRDYLRHLRQRSLAMGSQTPSPRYLLLMGSTSYDTKNRASNQVNHVPTYQSPNSFDPLNSYCSDAFYGLMDPSEGAFVEGGGDRMDLGIGRLPVRTVEQADAVVNKIREYMDPNNRGDWRNELVFLADDEDYNVHLNDCNELVRQTEIKYPQGIVRKLFMDAFQQESRPGGARYPEVNDRVNRAMEEGCLVFAYMGHGGVNGLAEERVMTLPEIDAWDHPGRYPLMVTATCEFARFDNPAVLSAGERALLNPRGGAIGLLTTSRVTFTNFNLNLSSRLFRDHLFRKDSTGRTLRLGDLYREAANPELGVVNTRNFALLGDPALRLAFPAAQIAIDPPSDTLQALEVVDLSGAVLDATGTVDSTFDGLLNLSVFDKAATLRTKQNDPVSLAFEYQEFKDLIFKGQATVNAGRWETRFRVPKDIAYAYGPGRVNAYAVRDESNLNEYGGNAPDAAGDLRALWVGGSAPQANCDTAGPQIRMSLNDTLFRSGGTVGPTNDLIIRLRDIDGLNTTGSGIGREMQLVRNGDWAGARTLNPYYRSDPNAYQSGRILYPLESLEPGSYTLQFRAWDVCNYSSTARLDFRVSNGPAFEVQPLSIFPNPLAGWQPAVVEINHNRPNRPIQVRMLVQNISGQDVYQTQTTLQSTGNYIRLEGWEGTHETGHPLPNGVYMLTVVLDCEGEQGISHGRILLAR